MVERRRCVLVEAAQLLWREGPSPGEGPDLGQERPPGSQEEDDRFAETGADTPGLGSEGTGSDFGLGQGYLTRCLIAGVDVAQEGSDELTSSGPKGDPVGLGKTSGAEVGVMVAVLPSVGPREAFGRPSQAGQVRRGPSPAAEDPLDAAPAESPMAAGCMEDLQTTLVGPAAERPRIDAQEPAGGPQGQPALRGWGGIREMQRAIGRPAGSTRA